MPLKVFLVTDDDPCFQDKIRQPGAMWLCPWMFDPSKDTMNPDGSNWLSIHYVKDHSKNRPPIQVRCPNGSVWVIDQKSSNGTGWIVTGEVPNITCSPSIVVPGYHGFLRDGVFTDDLEGRTY